MITRIPDLCKHSAKGYYFLHLYGLLYDERRPVVCSDELPVQLLGDVVTPLPSKRGAPRREDYEYERGGVAVLLVAFEPLTGRRVIETSRQQTKADYGSGWSPSPKTRRI